MEYRDFVIDKNVSCKIATDKIMWHYFYTSTQIYVL